MNSNRMLSHATALAALSLVSSLVLAAPINGDQTGLIAPTQQITFSEHVLDQNTQVTNQYADLGVTFTPGLYYNPFDPDASYYTPVIAGQFLSNYTTGQNPATLASITINFATVQTRAAFGLAANDSAFSFTAYLGNQMVESFGAADVGFAFYGFYGDLFDSIVVTSLGSPYEAGFPDFFDVDNLQFDASLLTTDAITPNAVVPEPGLGALLGLGLVGALAMRRRSARTKAA